MVIGGAALQDALARAALARGISVFGGYGQSKSGPMLTGAHLKRNISAGISNRKSAIARRRAFLRRWSN